MPSTLHNCTGNFIPVQRVDTCVYVCVCVWRCWMTKRSLLQQLQLMEFGIAAERRVSFKLNDLPYSCIVLTVCVFMGVWVWSRIFSGGPVPAASVAVGAIVAVPVAVATVNRQLPANWQAAISEAAAEASTQRSMWSLTALINLFSETSFVIGTEVHKWEGEWEGGAWQGEWESGHCGSNKGSKGRFIRDAAKIGDWQPPTGDWPS